VVDAAMMMETAAAMSVMLMMAMIPPVGLLLPGGLLR
jgi:hypothetical protein